jgi:hypothetical protein
MYLLLAMLLSVVGVFGKGFQGVIKLEIKAYVFAAFQNNQI